MGKRILIVDDHEELRESIALALRYAGYEVLQAGDGIEGLKAIAAHRPDCVVIDVKMPGLDGNQLVNLLRGDPETDSIPLVILSAMMQSEDIYRGLISGADQYLTKPTHPTVLIAAIERAIQISLDERSRQWNALADQGPPV
jgi:DNA-binding response OmpR family regulator